MTVTMELSDKEVRFLNKMVSDMTSYMKISSIEDAVKECIKMAMFDASEPMAADEGI
jgi:hypothetical protein